MCSKNSNCKRLDDRQAVACSARQLNSRRKLRQVHCSNTERNRGTCPATRPPECKRQHCTQSFHLFALCSSTCTSSRSPNWWEVSWPQVPIPSWMSKSNRAANVFTEECQSEQPAWVAKLMNNCEAELKEVNVDEPDSDGRIQMTTRQYRRQQTHRSSRESRRYDENVNACEENQYPENMIDRFSCRTWQKPQEGKQTLDNAETDTRSRSPTGAAQSTAARVSLKPRSETSFSSAGTCTSRRIKVRTYTHSCKPRSRWDRSTRWVNF